LARQTFLKLNAFRSLATSYLQQDHFLSHKI